MRSSGESDIARQLRQAKYRCRLNVWRSPDRGDVPAARFRSKIFRVAERISEQWPHGSLVTSCNRQIRGHNARARHSLCRGVSIFRDREIRGRRVVDELPGCRPRSGDQPQALYEQGLAFSGELRTVGARWHSADLEAGIEQEAMPPRLRYQESIRLFHELTTNAELPASECFGVRRC